MFLIFGFIIIGLSLVSMCVNVIQLKVEEGGFCSQARVCFRLFEELLISMMEEYGAPGAASAAELQPKLNIVDLWKMWKKRRNRRRQSGPSGKLNSNQLSSLSEITEKRKTER